MISDQLAPTAPPFVPDTAQATHAAAKWVTLPTFVSPARLILCGLALGVLFDVLFYGKMLGVSVPLFVAASVAALFWASKMEDVRPARQNLWVLGPLFFFAAMVLVRANPFITFLNLCAILGLLGLLAYFFSHGRLARLGLIGYALAFTVACLHALTLPIPLLARSLGGRRAASRSKSRMLPVLRGVLLAVPVLLVFTALLASADLVFARIIEGILSLNLLPNFDEAAGQTVVAVLIGWVLAGGLAFAVGRGQSAGSGDEEAWDATLEAIPRHVHIGFVEVATVLALVNGLFLLFGLIQFAYLFGGSSNIGAAGYTYADYARRGFFELVAVSVLTLGLVLGLHHIARRDTARQRLIFNGLCTLTVGLVLLLLASAYRRMSLYEDAYGYTELRLYVQIFEMWLAAALVWLAAVLWVQPRSFAIGAFVAALGFLGTLNLANPDATIARENLDHYRTSGVLDTSYLADLSEDAVPTLLFALDSVKGEERDALAQSLARRLQNMDQEGSWREWQAFHLSRNDAYNTLTANRARLGKVVSPAALIWVLLPPLIALTPNEKYRT